MWQHLGDEGGVGLGKVGGRREVAGQLLAAVVAVVFQKHIHLPQRCMHLQAPASTSTHDISVSIWLCGS